MARGVNKVILIGNLGRDPEVKYTASGSAMVNVTVATSESWNDKQTNERVERTEWHRVVAYRRLAEIMGEYLRKGSKVYIEGKLQTRKWQDQNGQDRWTTEIVANEMQMLGSRSDDMGAARSGGFRDQRPAQAPQQSAPPQQAPQQQPQAPQQAATTVEDGFTDDDIPF